MKCETRCDNNIDGFLCRAYGVDYASPNGPICYLHSVDTISAGISTLVNAPNWLYKEREPCIDSKNSPDN